MKYTREKEEIIEQEKELIERKRTVEFEKGDTLALIIAAMTTILPMFLGILALFVGIIWLLFLH